MVLGCALMLFGPIVGFFAGVFGSFVFLRNSGAALAGGGEGADLILGLCILAGVFATIPGLFVGLLLAAWITSGDD